MASELSPRSQQRLADKAAGLRATTSSPIGTGKAFQGVEGYQGKPEEEEDEEEKKKREERLRLFSASPFATSQGALDQIATGPSLALQKTVPSPPRGPVREGETSLVAEKPAEVNPFTVARDNFVQTDQAVKRAAAVYRDLPAGATPEQRAQARRDYADSLRAKADSVQDVMESSSSANPRSEFQWVQSPFAGRDTTERGATDAVMERVWQNRQGHDPYGGRGPYVDRGPGAMRNELAKQGIDPYSIGSMGEGTLREGGGMDVASIAQQQEAIRNADIIAKEIRLEQAREREALRKGKGKDPDYDVAIDAAKRRAQLEEGEGFGSRMSIDSARKMALDILKGDKSGLDRAIKEAKAGKLSTELPKGRGAEVIQKEASQLKAEREAREEGEAQETVRNETAAEKRKREREERAEFMRRRKEVYG